DKEKLLEIGLSFIPQDCKTARAIKDAIRVYKEEMNWREARNFVLRNSYSPIAQYSPVNLGFQTIGFLYGKDFGDAICKAVNCGYDTDCTGASLGALLGIILGKDGLPDKWIKPLSDKIATNSSWGGIVKVREPKNLNELTKRVCRIGKKVFSLYGEENARGKKTLSVKVDLSFRPDENIKKLWYLSPTKVDFDLYTLLASVDYLDNPVVQLGISKDFRVTLRNPRVAALEVEVLIKPPEGWKVEPRIKKITIGPGAESICNFSIRVDDIRALNTSNQASLCVSVKGRAQLEQIPLVFIGANRWLLSQVFREKIKASSLENNPEPVGLDENWTVVNFLENELKLEEEFQEEPGIIYLRHYVYSPNSRDVKAGLPSNCPFKMWLNGKPIHEVKTEGILRPNYLGDGRSYVNTKLKKGWNQFFIKLAHKGRPVEVHFIIAGSAPFCHGLFDLMECKFPWEI
ncbi:ADP-ribosylglycohydrolase family protein, partial [Candidatus Aerophobetes bacterium]